MPLTEVKIRNARAAEKPRKLSDEKGLYIFGASEKKGERTKVPEFDDDISF
jgi:hypothetical protein